MIVDRINFEREKERTNHTHQIACTQSIQEAIIRYVIMERLPLSKIDSKHFNRLLHGGYFRIHIICRYKLKCLLKLFLFCNF